MKRTAFITDDFLLETREARRLHHDVAAERRWENLTQIRIQGDHHKWRVMRADGWNDANS